MALLMPCRYNAAQFFPGPLAAPVEPPSGYSPGVLLRLIGFYWGILGVTALITSAVVRLSPRIAELDVSELSLLHWAVLLIFTPYMAYAEGYKGFHLNFAPRVVRRALSLREGELHGPRLAVLSLLAPAFCMGFIHATRKRIVISLAITSGIVVLVLLVSRAPQPWRGIIDAGVVTGLALGICSLLWHWLRFDLAGARPTIAADLP